jgi:hypothetical protein
MIEQDAKDNVIDFVAIRADRDRELLTEQLIGMAATTGFAVGVAATLMLCLIYTSRE